MDQVELLQRRVAKQFLEGYPGEHRAFARKAVEEAQELADEPDDLTEAADLLIVLLGYLTGRGLLFVELLDAANDKMTINEKRQWERMPNGAWKHV